VLYSFIKDALLSKVGVVKVWWECRQEVERETYLDQPDDAFALIVAQPGVEVVEHTEREIASPADSESVMAGHSASEDARERAYDPAIHLAKKMDPRVKPAGDIAVSPDGTPVGLFWIAAPVRTAMAKSSTPARCSARLSPLLSQTSIRRAK
jgi:hypothetical protein